MFDFTLENKVVSMVSSQTEDQRKGDEIMERTGKESICLGKGNCEMRRDGCEEECCIRILANKNARERMKEIARDYAESPATLAGDYATMEKEYWKLREENMLLKSKYSILKNLYETLVVSLEENLDEAV